MGQQTLPADDGGRWIALPNAERAVEHATPFPDFGVGQRVGMAVYDSNLAQMRRIVEAER